MGYVPATMMYTLVLLFLGFQPVPIPGFKDLIACEHAASQIIVARSEQGLPAKYTGTVCLSNRHRNWKAK